jgi:hypothetical protein
VKDLYSLQSILIYANLVQVYTKSVTLNILNEGQLTWIGGSTTFYNHDFEDAHIIYIPFYIPIANRTK